MNFDTRIVGQRPLQYSGFVIAGNVDVMKARKKVVCLEVAKIKTTTATSP